MSTTREAPPGPWDVLVIGAGLSGLTTASILAHEGLRVLVVEGHVVPGGFTHTFSRGPFTWDVGVHSVGRIDGWEGGLLSRIGFGAWTATEDDRVEFPWGRRTLGGGPGRWIDAVDELATEAWQQFSIRTRGVRRGGDPRTTAEFLADLDLSPEERAQVTARWAYLGEVPQRSSAVAHALMGSSFQAGNHYPAGGAGQIAPTLIRGLVKRGGACLVGARVQEIVLEGTRRGVRVGDRVIEAEVVVSALGVRTPALLAPAHRNRPWARALEALPRSVGHVALYVGLDRHPAGASTANVWVHNRWPAERAVWDPRVEERPQAIYASFPALKAGDGAPTATLVAFVPDDLFGRRGEAYRAMKERVTSALLHELRRQFPDLEPVHVELSTPRTTTRFLGAPAAYGPAAVPARYLEPHLRPATGVRGLVLAGSDLVLGSVMGAVAGGALASVEVLGPGSADRWLARPGPRPPGHRS